MSFEIHFVTGKGGVGKSAVAAALASSFAEQGLKTLLVELGDISFYKNYLHLPVVDFTSRKWKPNLEIALWSGQDCLKEYALHLIKSETLFKLFFENPVSRTLVNVAPGLPELSVLGKATSQVRKVGPAMSYDRLVVDGYATGHFMSLLKAPRGLATAIKIGPMGEQSRDIDEVLKDSKISHYHVVATPHDLPVTEGIELFREMEEWTGIVPKFWLNQVADFHGLKFTEKSAEVSTFRSYLNSQNDRKISSAKKLKEAKISFHSLEMIFKNENEEILKHLQLEVAKEVSA